MRLEHWLRQLQNRGRIRGRRRGRVELLEDRIAPGDIAFAAIGLVALPDLFAPAPQFIEELNAPSAAPDRRVKILEVLNRNGLSTTTDDPASASGLVVSSDLPRPALPDGGSLDPFADMTLPDALLDLPPAAAPPVVEPVTRPALPTIEAPTGGGGSGSDPISAEGSGGTSAFPGTGGAKASGGGQDFAGEGSGGAALMSGPPYPGGTPPTAVNDSAGVSYTRSVTINVRPNDSPGSAYWSAVALAEGPKDAGATVSLNNGYFTYTAPQNWDLSDTFKYKYTSSAGDSNVATVSLYHVNGAPFAVEDSGYGALAGETLYFSEAEGLLTNDYDYDKIGFPGSGFTIAAEKVDDPLHGTVTVNSGGSFLYRGNDDYVGPDEFTYRVTDGQSYSQKVKVKINVNELRLSQEGIDVSEQTAEVWVGEKVTLSLSIVGAGGLQLEGDPVWSIPDRAVADYVMSRNYATLVPFTDNEGVAVDFHWITTGAKEVSVNATVVGKGVNDQVTADGSFAVKKPSVNVTTTMDGVHLWHGFDPPDSPDLAGYVGHNVVQLGNWHEKNTVAEGVAGIKFEFTTDDPEGQYQWTQVADVTSFRMTDDLGVVYEQSGANVLDGSVRYGNHEPDAPSVGDSPINNLLPVDRSVERVERFSMYLMYKSSFGDMAIFVPLTRTSWNWRYKAASVNGTQWQLVPGSVYSEVEGTFPMPEPPQWAGNYKDLTPERVDP